MVSPITSTQNLWPDLRIPAFSDNSWFSDAAQYGPVTFDDLVDVVTVGEMPLHNRRAEEALRILRGTGI